MSNKIFSFDAETDGLWGRVFAIAAIVRENGIETKSFYGQLPVDVISNQWVRENVVPNLGDETHDNYKDLISDFAAFYMQNKQNATVVTHVGFPVESGLLREMHNLGYIGDWDAPFPLVDTSSMLLLAVEDPTSELKYAEKYCIKLPEGGAHNPLFDCRLTAEVYQHLLSRFAN